MTLEEKYQRLVNLAWKAAEQLMIVSAPENPLTRNRAIRCMTLSDEIRREIYSHAPEPEPGLKEFIS
jgi:hypothetical protein